MVGEVGKGGGVSAVHLTERGIILSGKRAFHLEWFFEYSRGRTPLSAPSLLVITGLLRACHFYKSALRALRAPHIQIESRRII